MVSFCFYSFCFFNVFRAIAIQPRSRSQATFDYKIITNIKAGQILYGTDWITITLLLAPAFMLGLKPIFIK